MIKNTKQSNNLPPTYKNQNNNKKFKQLNQQMMSYHLESLDHLEFTGC